MLSTEPPAGYATTMRTGLDGNVCVCACVATRLSVSDASAAKAKVRAVIFPVSRRSFGPAILDIRPRAFQARCEESVAGNRRNSAMVERQNIFPEGLSKRVVKGQLLYAPVVTVVPGKLVFLSGILARNSK